MDGLILFMLGFMGLMTFLCVVSAAMSIKIAIDAKITVKAMEKSTHQIQYVPIDTPDLTGEGPKDPFQEVDYSKYNEEYSKELKKEMPFFASEEDDIKVRSI